MRIHTHDDYAYAYAYAYKRICMHAHVYEYCTRIRKHEFDLLEAMLAQQLQLGGFLQEGRTGRDHRRGPQE